MPDSEIQSSSTSFRQIGPRAVACFVLLICIWGVISSWRAGASRLLTYHGRAARLIVQADMAVEMTPNDPEAHAGRAFVLLNNGELTHALPEYERAAALRPRDYFLWLELGRARDLADDEQGAIQALSRAARLAPEYAQPRWHYGNVLFRAGREAEAFEELRQAALRDQTFLLNFIDLAWGASGGDAARVLQIVQPVNATWRTALVKFFIKRGKIQEALTQLEAVGSISKEDRREILGELLSAGHYAAAYRVWANDSDEDRRESGIGSINDSGFESRMSRDELGFGWRLTRDTEAVRISLDRSKAHAGAQSLRIDFRGDSNSREQLLKQLILVEPKTRYRLRFFARTEEIVTGGLPQVEISDASNTESLMLAQSAPLPEASSEWREFTVDFTTGEATGAVVLSLSRQSCSSGPCPIFGRLWLDGFAMQKLTN